MDRQRILEHYVCGHRDQSLEATRLFDLAAIKFESALQFSYDDESVLNRYRCDPLFCLYLAASRRISPHLTTTTPHHPSPLFYNSVLVLGLNSTAGTRKRCANTPVTVPAPAVRKTWRQVCPTTIKKFEKPLPCFEERKIAMVYGL